MGNYNPHAPVVLGNEWVPLRDPGFHPDNTTEIGTMIHIDNLVAPVTGYYYIAENVTHTVNGIADIISVYPAGQEDDTGPIQQVVIPCSAVGITGAGVTGTLVDVQNPADDTEVVFTMGDPSTQNVGFNYDVASYQAQLQGKRILNVEILFQAAGSPENLTDVAELGNAVTISIIRTAGGTSGAQAISGALIGPQFIGQVVNFQSIPLGDINQFWTPTNLVGSHPKAFPWRWEELNLFSTTAPLGQQLYIRINNFNPNGTGTIQIGYTAMRVTYCEERRVLYGADVPHFTTGRNNYAPGPRPIQLLTPAFAAPSNLPIGDYTVTLSHRLLGDDSFTLDTRDAPLSYGITELENVYPQRGRLVKQSLTPGDTFTVDDVAFLPQLTLHTSTGIVTGSHPYGTLVEAPVYGSITAAQILTNLGNTGGSYPQVRFYARHFDAVNPLRLANGLFTVDITPDELTALPEIADGWRSVVLRFPTAPTGTDVGGTWTFSSAGESAGTRWEVLGENGISPSAPQNIGPATYQAPSGSTQTLTWKSPAVTGATADTTADLSLLFSQDPPAITGLAVTQVSQALTQISDTCGDVNSCVPSALTFNRVAWTSAGVFDYFDRTTVASVGTAPSGQAWAIITGTAADYNDDGDKLQITHNDTVKHEMRLTTYTAAADVYVRGSFHVSIAPTGAGTYEADVIARYTDANNRLDGRIFINASSVSIGVRQVAAGVTTAVGNATVASVSGYDDISYELQVIGSLLAFKIWPTGGLVPAGPQVEMTTTVLAAGQVGLGFTAAAALPVTTTVNNFFATPATLVDGLVELQRKDTEDNLWQTILLSSEVAVTGFDDYEARVGVLSSYRARYVNSLDFVGPWSVTGTGTIPAPGVTTTGDGVGVLIFTSNIDPAGSLAYTMVWEGQPIELFAFPEADTQIFQRLYGRDFQVAFRPLERGGEQFERVILVQTASVTQARLANMDSLRDLAWDDLPYVCVRDELGNRWFASVQVPAGSVQNKRRIYLAQIRVTEVTDTPAPVGQWP